MTAEVVQESKPSYGVTVTKKVSDGNYGGEEVSAWVSADVPLGANAEQIAAALNDASFIAKATVFAQLGIEFTNEEGILRAAVKRVERAFPGTKEVEYQGESVRESIPANAAVRVKGKQFAELPTWLIEEAAKHGVTEVWDNRPVDPTTNKPWFKPTTKRMLPNGKELAFWPPKNK